MRTVKIQDGKRWHVITEDDDGTDELPSFEIQPAPIEDDDIPSIDTYLDAAREHGRFASDRGLAKYLGIGTATLNHWRTRRAWPGDQAMIRLARAAEAQEDVALIYRDYWRTKSARTRALLRQLIGLIAIARGPYWQGGFYLSLCTAISGTGAMVYARILQRVVESAAVVLLAVGISTVASAENKALTDAQGATAFIHYAIIVAISRAMG